jgi:hypothetical protein
MAPAECKWRWETDPIQCSDRRAHGRAAWRAMGDAEVKCAKKTNGAGRGKEESEKRGRANTKRARENENDG